MKKILFLSSEYTGGGHRSITKALCEQLSLHDPEIQFKVIDGFMLGNWLLRLPSHTYDTLAVGLPALWGFIYRLSNPFRWLVNRAVAGNIKRSFLEQIRTFQPDLIVSVHEIFVGSVIRILKKEGLDIPVISLVADLDNVTNLWADKDVKYIVCPSEEARRSMLKAGMTNEQLFLTGFPVRREFCDPCLPEPLAWSETGRKSLSVLLVSGSQGSPQVLRIINSLLKHERIHLTILAGYNTVLKKIIEKHFSKYVGNRLTVYGFIKEIKERMDEADLLILRASPNVLMEAVNLCKPVIVTGALRGQEEKNPQFVLRNKLGCYCRDVNELPELISGLLANDGEKLLQIARNEYRFRKPESARQITDLLVSTLHEKEGAVPKQPDQAHTASQL
ncbi:MGDG synthase family glycosyltransferase [Sporolactobacillus vineae]|uniref:MGDG synthase family glycosyltransferase n=1 Tax=Sporolactobacillus vineae TaxID=444463 RepID=UPI0002897D93|nr:glycosyltransferase [Sporolactobacillus vineae]